jgi:hypothetical protein
MYARFIMHGRRGKKISYFAKGRAGRFDDNPGEGKFGSFLRANQNGCRFAGPGLGLVLGVGEKGNLVRLSGGKIVDTCDNRIGSITNDRTADMFSQGAYGMHGISGLVLVNALASRGAQGSGFKRMTRHH